MKIESSFSDFCVTCHFQTVILSQKHMFRSKYGKSRNQFLKKMDATN